MPCRGWRQPLSHFDRWSHWQLRVCRCRVRSQADSNLVRDEKRRPIPSVPVRQETIGLFVADDLLRFGIEAQGPAQTVRGVGQVDQRAGAVSFPSSDLSDVFPWRMRRVTRMPARQTDATNQK
jgi:hypothetical protein